MKLKVVIKTDALEARMVWLSEHWYTLIHIIHLMCAISFMGMVFFEVVILEGMRVHLSEAEIEHFEFALLQRARKIMPWIVGLLFVTGLTMAYFRWGSMLAHPTSGFAKLLWIKIVVAFSVLGHFTYAQLKARDGCMNNQLFKRLHQSVALHMITIIILAKVMFVA